MKRPHPDLIGNIANSPSEGDSNELPERVSPPCFTMKNMILGQRQLQIDHSIA
jgi:hypothetical protein